MPLNPQEILAMASRDYILGNTTVEEQIEFISDQIKNPFDSGSSNFFKKLKNMVTADKLDSICIDLFGQMEDVYPNLEFDFSEYDQHLADLFNASYKFFIRHAAKNMRAFIQQYIYSSKNRKNLVGEYLNMKLPNYPKEQYGKKEFYILVTKLPAIVKDIFDDEISLEQYISYIERSDETPMYFKLIKDMLDKGMIVDHGITEDLFDQFKKSDQFDTTICKLQMMITNDLINPYLEENGLMDLRTPMVDDVVEESDEDDDDEDSDEE